MTPRSAKTIKQKYSDHRFTYFGKVGCYKNPKAPFIKTTHVTHEGPRLNADGRLHPETAAKSGNSLALFQVINLVFIFHGRYFAHAGLLLMGDRIGAWQVLLHHIDRSPIVSFCHWTGSRSSDQYTPAIG